LDVPIRGPLPIPHVVAAAPSPSFSHRWRGCHPRPAATEEARPFHTRRFHHRGRYPSSPAPPGRMPINAAGQPIRPTPFPIPCGGRRALTHRRRAAAPRRAIRERSAGEIRQAPDRLARCGRKVITAAAGDEVRSARSDLQNSDPGRWIHWERTAPDGDVAHTGHHRRYRRYRASRTGDGDGVHDSRTRHPHLADRPPTDNQQIRNTRLS